MPDLEKEKHVKIFLHEKQFIALLPNKIYLQLSVATGAVAAVALLTSLYQTRIYQDQANTAREQLQLSMQQNERQIKDAREQARLDQETDKRKTRAYIALNNPIISANIADHDMPIRFVFTNYGSSKARELSLDWRTYLTQYNPKDFYPVTATWDRFLKTETDLSPNGLRTFNLLIEISDHQSNVLRSSETVLVVYGALRYRDIFDDQHNSYFCYWISGDDFTKMVHSNTFPSMPFSYVFRYEQWRLAVGASVCR